MKIDLLKSESNAILWQKAAIIGSLWASIEIILGSFLHNLRIPISGLILSSIGVFILTAASKYWNERGLIIRIGFICALMKSISPSAVIFGPMIGIILEALIFEISTYILGRNVLGFVVAGGLAVSSNLVQKIFNLFIIYGFDLVRIYNNIYQIVINHIGNPGLNSNQIIIIFFLMEFIIGTISVLFALRIEKSKPIYHLDFDNNKNNGYSFFSEKTSNTSIPMLFFNFLIIVLILFSFKYLGIFYSIGIATIFIIYGYKIYSIKSLMKIRYIFEFCLIILFSGLIMGDTNDRHYWISKSGIFAGIEMILRASVLITGFSLISHELRNPVILEWIFKRKLKKLYCSLELAFSTLPLMIELVSNKQESIKKPVKNMSYLLSIADFLIKKEIANKRIYIVSGEINSGKSSFLYEVVKYLQKKEIETGGVFSQSVYSDGNKVGYDLVNIKTNERISFMKLKDANCNEDNNNSIDKIYSIGKFKYSEEALTFGKEILSVENLLNVDVIIVDEIGPSELQGDLWADSLDEIIRVEEKIIILVVRQSIVEDICKKFQIFPRKVFYPSDNPFTAVQEIISDNKINY
jgi:nucleoside-triphosphatase THEP1